MSNPIEDIVFTWILRHRVLKLFFVSIAAIGILGAAIDTMTPLVVGAQRYVYRALSIKPPSSTRDLYRRAYEIGSTFQYVLHESLPSYYGDLSLPPDPKQQARLATMLDQTYARSMGAFGFRAAALRIEKRTLEEISEDENSQFITLAAREFGAFEGHLLATNRAAAMFLRLGSEHASLEFHLRRDRARNADLTGVPGELEQGIVEDVKASADELSSLLRYAPPTLIFEMGTKESLLESVNRNNERLGDYFFDGSQVTPSR